MSAVSELDAMGAKIESDWSEMDHEDKTGMVLISAIMVLQGDLLDTAIAFKVFDLARADGLDAPKTRSFAEFREIIVAAEAELDTEEV